MRRAEAGARPRPRAWPQVGVLGDLQGPKIRIDRFKDGKVLE
jgi:pyruvate kinase